MDRSSCASHMWVKLLKPHRNLVVDEQTYSTSITTATIYN